MASNYTPERLAELSAGYGLDGGGYSFEQAPDALPGCVVWDRPDEDYVPWVNDIKRVKRSGYSSTGEMDSRIYAFLPCGPYGAPSDFAWPKSYVDGTMTYTLQGSGSLQETDRECGCNGRPDPDNGAAGHGPWEYTGSSLDPAHPSCPRCEGSGFITSDGGLWAVYDGKETTIPCAECGEDFAPGVPDQVKCDDCLADLNYRAERLGTIVVKMSTIFGLEEDEAVLYGRCRVY